MAVFEGTNASGGAPTLNGIAGSLVTVLDYWLVTIAGYTIVSTATNIRIYQPPAGLGYCLYVNDDGTASGDARRAVVRMCEATSTTGALVNPAPTVAAIANTSCNWYKSSAATATAVTYDITVSDGLGITPPFVVFNVSPSTSGCSQYWGDGVPQDANDPYCNYLSVCTVSATTIPASGGWFFGSGNLAVGTGTASSVGIMASARNRDGTVIGPIAVVRSDSLASKSGSMPNAPAYPHPDTGGMHHEYPKMACMAGTSRTTPGVKAIVSRAILPGVRILMHDGFSGIATYDTWNDTAHNASAVFKYIRIGTGTAAIGVETTDTFVYPMVG